VGGVGGERGCSLKSLFDPFFPSPGLYRYLLPKGLIRGFAAKLAKNGAVHNKSIYDVMTKLAEFSLCFSYTRRELVYQIAAF
jgi:hypothetical protein